MRRAGERVRASAGHPEHGEALDPQSIGHRRHISRGEAEAISRSVLRKSIACAIEADEPNAQLPCGLVQELRLQS
jgi:hypothetical protein